MEGFGIQTASVYYSPPNGIASNDIAESLRPLEYVLVAHELDRALFMAPSGHISLRSWPLASR